MIVPHTSPVVDEGRKPFLKGNSRIRMAMLWWPKNTQKRTDFGRGRVLLIEPQGTVWLKWQGKWFYLSMLHTGAIRMVLGRVEHNRFGFRYDIGHPLCSGMHLLKGEDAEWEPF